MPSRGQKRTATESASRASKRQAAAEAKEATAATETVEEKRVGDWLKKRGIKKMTLQAVQGILEHPLVELPESCKKMLHAALPWSICVPMGERAECQAAAVRMLGEVAAAVAAKLQAAADEAQAQVDGLQARTSSVQARVQAAEGEAAAAASAAETQHAALIQATEKMTAARTAVNVAKEEQQLGEAAARARLEEKAELETTLKDNVGRLKEGTWEEAMGPLILADCQSTAAMLNLEDSLKKSLPALVAKRELTPFDRMVLQQFEDKLQAKITATEQAEAGEAAAAQLREAKTKAAEEHLHAVTARQQQQAAAVSAAQARQTETAQAVEAARAAVARETPEAEQIRTGLDAKRLELAAFRDFHVRTFDLLREHDGKQATDENQAAQAVEEAAADAAEAGA